MSTITDTTRALVETALVAEAAQQADLDARRATLEQELDDVLARLASVTTRVEHMRRDLGVLDEPTDPDAPVPFEIIEDPWAEQPEGAA